MVCAPCYATSGLLVDLAEEHLTEGAQQMEGVEDGGGAPC